MHDGTKCGPIAFVKHVWRMAQENTSGKEEEEEPALFLRPGVSL